MINLNVYREAPLYADGREASGRAQKAERKYGRRIAPHLFVVYGWSDAPRRS